MQMLEAGIIAEGAKCELIDGELLEMPAEGPTHLVLAHRIADQLRTAYLNWGFWVRVGAPIVLADDSWPEPDVSVIAGPDSQYLARHPRGNETVLVVEVCQTSQTRDHEKIARYAAADVPEYWLLDVPGRLLELHRDPLSSRYALTQRIELTPTTWACLPRTINQRLDFAALLDGLS
jgi:Uma2 family endonuclease